MKTEVFFGQWLPDSPDFKNPGLEVAKGVYPVEGGYAPLPAGVDTTDDVSGTPIGAARFVQEDGTEITAVCTTSDLYVLGNAASGTGISLSATDRCLFEQFGTYVFATIFDDGTYYLNGLSDTGFGTIPGSGTIPNAKAMARVDDFLVMGHCKVSSVEYPFRIWWSEFNNPFEFEPNIATQSGYVEMPGHLGVVTGISGGDIGLIFQERGVSRFDYVGGSTAFQKSIISDRVGCVASASITQVNGMTYWLAEEGFYASNGGTPIPIADRRVIDYIRSNTLTKQWFRAQVSVDRTRKLITWNFPSRDFQAIYSYEQERWSFSEEEYDWLVEFKYEPVSEADIVTDGFFNGGDFYARAGTPIAATLTTGDFQIKPGQRVFINEVWPLTDNDTPATDIDVTVNYRDSLGATASTTTVDVGPLGFAPFNADGRYASVTISIAAGADWSVAQGFQVGAMPSGWT